MRPIKGLWAVWPAMKTEGHGKRLSQIFPLPPSNDAHILSSLHASIRFRTFRVKRVYSQLSCQIKHRTPN